jgi:hypothetical protein
MAETVEAVYENGVLRRNSPPAAVLLLLSPEGAALKQPRPAAWGTGAPLAGKALKGRSRSHDS